MSDLQQSTRAENSERVAARLLAARSPDAEISLEAIAFETNLPVEEVIAIVNEKSFAEQVRAISRARALVAIHTRGVDKLVESIQTQGGKELRNSIALLARLTGEAKARPPVAIQFNFDTLRKKAAELNPPDFVDPFELKVSDAADEFNEEGDDE